MGANIFPDFLSMLPMLSPESSKTYKEYLMKYHHDIPIQHHFWPRNYFYSERYVVVGSYHAIYWYWIHVMTQKQMALKKNWNELPKGSVMVAIGREHPFKLGSYPPGAAHVWNQQSIFDVVSSTTGTHMYRKKEGGGRNDSSHEYI